MTRARTPLGQALVEQLREGLMPVGAQKAWLFGRPFPLFALPYLGSLKSQLLIGPLAVPPSMARKWLGSIAPLATSSPPTRR